MKNITIKVVPDNKPKANGRLIDVPDDVFIGRSWSEHEDALSPYIPDGEHLVQIIGSHDPETGG